MPAFCPDCRAGRRQFKIWVDLPEQQQKADVRRMEMRARAAKASDFAPRFKDRTLADFADKKLLHDMLIKYVEEYPQQRDHGVGFFFFGGVGTGKSHAAIALCNALIDRYFLQVYFAKTGETMARIRRSIFENNNDSILRDVMTAELLVLDDLGIDNRTDYMVETLYRIIDHRYEHKLPTVITSNATLDDIGQRYLPQISSRINEMCILVKFGGEDRRALLRPQL